MGMGADCSVTPGCSRLGGHPGDCAPPASRDFPRRICLDRCTPAELAIRAAVAEVEKLAADPRLTDAVVLLDKARCLVADFVDEVEGPRVLPVEFPDAAPPQLVAPHTVEGP